MLARTESLRGPDPVDATTRVDVIVPTHDSGEVARECLRRLGSDPRVGRILVVDAASRPEYVVALRRWCRESGRAAELRPLRRNRGFAASVNEGLRGTSSPLVLLLNPDCLVAPGAIDALADALESRADCGLAGGLLLDELGREQRGSRRDLPGRRQAIGRGIGLRGTAWDFDHLGRPMPDEPVRVPAISGAFMLARRASIEVVGGLDERFFLHFEDLEWCARFGDHGLGVLFVPQATAVHEQGSSSRARPRFVRYHKHRSMLLFDRLRARSPWDRATRPLFVAAVWSAFVLGLVPRLLQPRSDVKVVGEPRTTLGSSSVASVG